MCECFHDSAEMPGADAETQGEGYFLCHRAAGVEVEGDVT